MKEASVTFQFPKSHATVQFTNGFDADKRRHTRLYVQAIDQYRYQREWSLTLIRGKWFSHVYQHPGRRRETEVGNARAEACIRRFLHLCANYPDLLFNVGNGERARSEGFIHFCEALHMGQGPTKRLL